MRRGTHSICHHPASLGSGITQHWKYDGDGACQKACNDWLLFQIHDVKLHPVHDRVNCWQLLKNIFQRNVSYVKRETTSTTARDYFYLTGPPSSHSLMMNNQQRRHGAQSWPASHRALFVQWRGVLLTSCLVVQHLCSTAIPSVCSLR